MKLVHETVWFGLSMLRKQSLDTWKHKTRIFSIRL